MLSIGGKSMKRIIAIISLFFSIYASALSDIDLVVKKTVIEAYTVGSFEMEMSPEWDDIYGLQFAENDSDQCLLTVTGYTTRPYYDVEFKFWVCINRDHKGYNGYLIKDQMIVD